MLKKARTIALIGAVAAMTLSAVPAFAGTSWVSFSGTLPIFQAWKELATDTNNNSSYAQANISYIGSDYKINMNVYDKDVKPEKQVSGTYYDADEGTLAEFNLDSSSEGHTVGLRGWTANWTSVQVEYSGNFRADS